MCFSTVQLNHTGGGGAQLWQAWGENHVATPEGLRWWSHEQRHRCKWDFFNRSSTFLLMKGGPRGQKRSLWLIVTVAARAELHCQTMLKTINNDNMPKRVNNNRGQPVSKYTTSCLRLDYKETITPESPGLSDVPMSRKQKPPLASTYLSWPVLFNDTALLVWS